MGGTESLYNASSSLHRYHTIVQNTLHREAVLHGDTGLVSAPFDYFVYSIESCDLYLRLKLTYNGGGGPSWTWSYTVGLSESAVVGEIQQLLFTACSQAYQKSAMCHLYKYNPLTTITRSLDEIGCGTWRYLKRPLSLFIALQAHGLGPRVCKADPNDWDSLLRYYELIWDMRSAVPGEALTSSQKTRLMRIPEGLRTQHDYREICLLLRMHQKTISLVVLFYTIDYMLLRWMMLTLTMPIELINDIIYTYVLLKALV